METQSSKPETQSKLARFFEQLRAFVQTEGWLTEQSNLWAARHYSGPVERVASLTVRILVEQENVDFERLHPATRFVDDLDMVELEGVDLVIALERAFGFKIPDEEAEQIETLSALISYLHERVQAIVA